MKHLKTIAPIALVLAILSATTVHAGTPLTVSVAQANLSAECDDLFDNGCALSDSAPGFSANFTFPTALLAAGQDWCFSPDTPNTTVLTLTGGDTLTLNTTQVCLLNDPSIGGIPDQEGNFDGTVNVTSGTGTYAGATGSGSFSGTYSSQGGSITFVDIEFDFASYSLDVQLPPPPCTDPSCTGGGSGSGGPNPAATPELSSLSLFASALAGLGGYVAMRRRTR